MIIKCINGCGADARPLRADFVKDGEKVYYTKAATEPAFCTKRCAAAWALNNIYDEYTFCKEHGWEFHEDGECSECLCNKHKEIYI